MSDPWRQGLTGEVVALFAEQHRAERTVVEGECDVHVERDDEWIVAVGRGNGKREWRARAHRATQHPQREHCAGTGLSHDPTILRQYEPSRKRVERVEDRNPVGLGDRDLARGPTTALPPGREEQRI